MFKKAVLLVLSSFIMSFSAYAQNCHEDISVDDFKASAVSTLSSEVALGNNALLGLDLALEAVWDFISKLDKSSSLCTKEFHIYDHVTSLFGKNQNAFSRFPKNNFIQRNAIGQGMGFDISFLEKGVEEPDVFKAAINGVLHSFRINKDVEGGFGLSRIPTELNYQNDEMNKFKEVALKVCKLEDAQACYNLALYRLFTFPMAVDKGDYLTKGSAIDFADLLKQRGEDKLAALLLIEVSRDVDYIKAYMNKYPEIDFTTIRARELR